MSIILSVDELANLCEQLRKDGKRIAFASGHFDLLHLGHLRLLQQARASADFLVAGVFDDASTRLRKGPGRPVQPAVERAELLAGLGCVDYVIVIAQETAIDAIELLKPDVYVHGGVCAPDGRAMPEADLVRGNGGTVVCLPLLPGHSTARLVEVIRNGDDWMSAADREDRLQAHRFEGEGAVATFTFALDPRGPAADGISRFFSIQGPHERDLILNQIHTWRSFYESDVLQYLAMAVPSGGVMLDVGANIGNHSIFLGTYLAALVIALEPAPELAALLRHNLAMNSLNNVIVVERAVGAKPGTGYVQRPLAGTRNSGATQIRPVSRLGRRQNWDLVEITTVDIVLEELSPEIAGRPISLFKVDVEGDEYAVLCGARRLLEQHRPHLLVELTKDFLFQKVAAFLSDFGYSPGCRFGSIAPTYHFVAKNDPR